VPTSLLAPAEIRGALPLLALTQGDPAGIGPEILLELLARSTAEQRPYHPLLIAERAALEVLRTAVPDAPWDRLVYLDSVASAADLPDDPEAVAVLDPVGSERTVVPGRPGPADAAGALAALDLGIDLATSGVASALVTCPLSKDTIHRHVLPGFVGHTDYLAEKAGLERYGRDYLMAFLAPCLRVALLTTHLPLRQALDRVTERTILEALECLHRHAPAPDRPKIAVAGLNPHAGEGGLLGEEEWQEIRPAVETARARGIDVHGPESPDSLFVRARRGEFDWVLALYHDQGLIAVKTAAFGTATNCTLGLPYLRTSVDHGTAYAIAGRGIADPGPLERVVETTLELLGEGRPTAAPSI
jgi:4-hydroxythreonine-4-phosphate dehydrogenase